MKPFIDLRVIDLRTGKEIYPLTKGMTINEELMMIQNNPLLECHVNVYDGEDY